ncbi:MAG: DUF3316 domain-containing protein [Bacteroides sp.]|nr:DUF3316 domain-containing protein [Bacteroides sp.]
MRLYKTIILLCALLLGSSALKAQEEQKTQEIQEAQEVQKAQEVQESPNRTSFPDLAQQLRSDSASRNRLITRATLYGVGFTNVFDTYLSPQEYTGIDFRISRESMRMTRLLNGRVSRQVFFQADLGYTHNKADNNNTFSGLANWNYGLHYNFPLTGNFKLLAGAVGDLNGGFAYNLRNGNNPAQARAYINLAASGMAVWNLRIKNRPVTLRYQLNLPLAGIMFMPNYGQSYYEIFTLGHGEGVVNFTSLHNQPSLRQMLTADFPVGRARMRLAYLWDAQQCKVNEIKTHTYSHVFMVGFVKELYLFR